MLEGLQKLNHNGAHGSSPLTTPVYSARSRAKGRPLMKAPNGYEVDVPGLAQAVAACVPEPTHRALISCLRAFGQLSDAKLATTRGGDDGHYLVRRKVLASNGAVVHEDHQVWIKEQLALDAGDASKTFTRLLDAKYLLSKCQLTKIYLVHDKGTDNPAAFVQVAIRQEDEFIDARAFDKYVWRTPANLADLLDAVEGDPVPTGDRSRVRPPAYMLEAVVDVDAFVAEAEAIDAQVRKLLHQRTYKVTGSIAPLDGAQTGEVKTHSELFPGWDRHPHKSRRLFNDWKNSSAGRSGARLCEHWVMQLSDWTDPTNKNRALGLVPMWTFPQKIARIDASKGDTYTHFGKLQTLDRRVKVPFGWYFYMLHGNLVGDGSGKRVVADAEDGLIVLPEHDYRVLKAWREYGYGF
ncbi:MAG: hypothetical protein WBL16_08045 [Zwartia sp.]